MSRHEKTLPLFQGQEVVAEGRGKIRPRARLLKTIGAELISSEVVAVIELVRNSYDADATEVHLEFNDPQEPEVATLEIRDNGHGMTKEVLLGPWLEPATDHKMGRGSGGTDGERSPMGRRRLGSKGVGRFAAQRLGERLHLLTRPSGGITELHAWFDWAELDEGEYLDQVQVPWREQHPAHLADSGTQLIIAGLRDRWTSDRFDRLKLGLGRLISPTLKEDFRILITINGAREEVRSAIDLHDAMYSIEGKVAGGGLCTISYSDINGDHEDWERTVLWPEGHETNCGPFSFRIAAWDLDSAPLRHFLKLSGKEAGLREFRKIVRDHSGIALYRDDFRILPYGEPDNDWLRLDRRRVNNPTMRLSNNQILGTIHLTADDNPSLQDQTNREGLVTNEAYAHLQEVVLELLGFLETRRFAARRSMDVDWQRRTSSLPSVESGDEDRVIELLKSVEGPDSGRGDAANELRRLFQELQESSTETVRHYAGLAVAGQLSALVFRQLQHPIKQVQSELDLAVGDLRETKLEASDIEDMRESLETAIQHLKTIQKRIEKLDPLAVGGRGRRVTAVNLYDVLAGVVDAFEDESTRLGIAIDFQGDRDLKVETNPEIAQQVLASLLDNGLQWASQANGKAPVVRVRLSKSGFWIADSGPGIPENLRGVVFEPHFTTRDGAHGLGLTLAKDLLKTIGGRIRLADPVDAKFEVTLVPR
jgi:signal transduction histidine kinase